MAKETICTDNIECPYCGERFDGGEAMNYSTVSDTVQCPHCERYMTVYPSVTYTAFAEEDGS